MAFCVLYQSMELRDMDLRANFPPAIPVVVWLLALLSAVLFYYARAAAVNALTMP